MKKQIIILISAFFVSLQVFAQENTLVFVHPTAYNLELFTYMTDNKIIDIEDLKIIGVYHEKEAYDYKNAEKFLEENDYPNIELREIKEDLFPNQLYKKNECTTVFNDLFKNSKGVFFFGGPDMPPSIYGEPMSLLTRMTDPYRHYFEASFLFHLIGGSQNKGFNPLLDQNKDYIVYAICLGMQTMNVAAGGTMTQDIPSELYNQTSVEEVLKGDNNYQHRNYNNNLIVDETLFAGNFHEIKIQYSSSMVGKYKGNMTPLIYSNHHQAIETLGQNLKVIATSVDGKIVEAFAHEKYPNVVGIQFHPEGTYLHNEGIKYRKNPNDELKSGKKILIDHNSYEFHLAFWKTFSEKMEAK